MGHSLLLFLGEAPPVMYRPQYLSNLLLLIGCGVSSPSSPSLTMSSDIVGLELPLVVALLSPVVADMTRDGHDLAL